MQTIIERAGSIVAQVASADTFAVKKHHAPFLRLTRGQAQNAEGLELLRLALWVNGAEADHMTAVSGQPGRQVFRKAADRRPGSMEPIPEGEYDLGDPDAIHRINWASGRIDDYDAKFNGGLGPIWIAIKPAAGNPCPSWDFGVHSDWNEEYAPGTSGCVGLQGETGGRDLNRLKRLAAWCAAYSPAKLYVDWGFGTCPRPG